MAVGPFDVDSTPLVKVEILGDTRDEVQGYSYTSDVLTLTDSFTVDLANPDGVLSQLYHPGDPVRLKMTDPTTESAKDVVRVTGLVTGVRYLSQGGEKLQIQGADHGWHLENNDAPLWLGMTSLTFDDLLKKTLKSKTGGDFGWDFLNPDGSVKIAAQSSMDLRRRLNQGRAGVERSAATRANNGQSPISFIPPIQTDTGIKIGQLLIDYARREHYLINVDADGALLIWQPNYTKAADYAIEYHADERRSRNNVVNVSIDEMLDGLYTDITCVSTAVHPSIVRTNENPNADKFRGRYVDDGTRKAGVVSKKPRFDRRMTFGDSDMLDKKKATQRAQWAWQRGMFDSWTYTCEVFGHSQNGLYWCPDSMVSIDDSVHGIKGTFYVSACTYSRQFGRTGGTRTKLTIKQKNLLVAA